MASGSRGNGDTLATGEKQRTIATPKEQERLADDAARPPDPVVLLEAELQKIRSHMARLQTRVDELEDHNPGDTESLSVYNQVISRREVARLEQCP